MATTTRIGPNRPARQEGPLEHWLLEGKPKEPEGPYAEPHGHTHSWKQVMCLTGVDYFSTLGYQPGIAALAAGALSPIATLILVLVTLFGALPMYKRVVEESPHGDGSISMLERLLSWWQGKLFVLVLIGFVATGFVITITLSAADATAHITENPFTSFLHGYEVPITLMLIGLLGAVFLKGFKEAIGIAVGIVIAYLALNVVVIGVGFVQIARQPELLGAWQDSLFRGYGNPAAMVVAALVVFPRLALGLSGFETGVVVMPLVKGDPSDTYARPAGRIRNARALLTAAASIMSLFLITSSLVTTLLIPQDEFLPGGEANGRALAFLAHEYLGDLFGTVYDVSTILILWFAGASALAGLLSIVPRYLPRYGMAPDWTRATRPLVLVYVVVCFAVTIFFKASVTDQAGAYATGVLAVITSATVAVTLSAWRRRQRQATLGFGLVTLIFVYTTAVTVIQDPGGIQIAGLFILAIVVVSLVSRAARSTELRTTEVEFDDVAQGFIDEAGLNGPVRLIANHPDQRNSREYLLKEREEREASHIPFGDPVLFLEVTGAGRLRLCGEGVGARRRDRRSPGAPVRGRLGAKRDRRRAASGAAADGAAAPRLLRLDRRQPAEVPGPLRPLRRGGHRPGHARGAPQGRAGSGQAAGDPRRLMAERPATTPPATRRRRSSPPTRRAGRGQSRRCPPAG
jgi:hypothetical protein